MPAPWSIIALLLAVCFTLATSLHLRLLNSPTRAQSSDSLLAVILGDSRRLFANHFVAKADAYFHSGYYPTIFDQAAPRESAMTRPHPAHDGAGGGSAETHDHHDPDHDHEQDRAGGHDHEEDQEHDHGQEHAHEDHSGHAHAGTDGHEAHEDELAFLDEPKDWIERFGRHFFPSTHSHLDGSGKEREMLPWLRLSAELDPHRVKTYTVAGYWLRTRMGKVDEAEQFLREGWRNNPDSYEILLELGRLLKEDRKDTFRARNVWELALQKWTKEADAGAEPDSFALQQLLAQLAFLEESESRWQQALYYLRLLRKVSPNPAVIEDRIREAEERLETDAATAAPSPAG